MSEFVYVVRTEECFGGIDLRVFMNEQKANEYAQKIGQKKNLSVIVDKFLPYEQISVLFDDDKGVHNVSWIGEDEYNYAIYDEGLKILDNCHGTTEHTPTCLHRPAQGLTAINPGPYSHMYISENKIESFNPEDYPNLQVLYIAGNPIKKLPKMKLSELVYGKNQDASEVDCPGKRQHTIL